MGVLDVGFEDATGTVEGAFEFVFDGPGVGLVGLHLKAVEAGAEVAEDDADFLFAEGGVGVGVGGTAGVAVVWV